MSTELDPRILDSLVGQGVLPSTKVDVMPLTGGVSCEIYLIEHAEKRVVVKRALEKLKVKDDWFADVNRNKTEQQYLSYVAQFMPDSVPEIYCCDDELNFFCMEMLGGSLKNWKTLLMHDESQASFATKSGEVLGKIHAYSLNDPEAEVNFQTLENFKQLRIDPYLITTGQRNPNLQKLFEEEAERLAKVQQCLVHGDFSPKNILVSEDRFAVLDCEVAWYGDPVFDVAFLLNHFMLKALYHSEYAEHFTTYARLSWQAYQKHAEKVVAASVCEGGTGVSQFEKKMVNLLAMLMLARVDGKSPVEYLKVSQQALVRDFVHICLLDSKPETLAEFITLWFDVIHDTQLETPIAS